MEIYIMDTSIMDTRIMDNCSLDSCIIDVEVDKEVLAYIDSFAGPEFRRL